ncbi:MAG: hypothetical protein AB7Q00_14515 [Phycisphaerales bacterium]
MAVTSKIEGVERIVTNLNKKIGSIEGASREGLWAGGLVIQGEAMRRVPVEYGNLRGSAYTRNARKIEIEKREYAPKKSLTDQDVVEVGFGAAYAIYIHENLEMKLAGKKRPSGLGVYWGPSGEPKFLENAVRAKQREILARVAQYARSGI